jgi:hypothetical protein
MFNIFMSGCLQAKEGDPWNEVSGVYLSLH